MSLNRKQVVAVQAHVLIKSRAYQGNASRTPKTPMFCKLWVIYMPAIGKNRLLLVTFPKIVSIFAVRFKKNGALKKLKLFFEAKEHF